MPAGRNTGRILALLLGYLGLTIWLTWPLAASLAIKLPCTAPLACHFDTLYSAWAMTWLSHALIAAPWHLGDANIYFPDRSALYYGPAGVGALPYALPAFLATGNAAVALNVTLLACTALTALALHWVVWRWTGSGAAGFLAAWTLLMNRFFLWGFVASTTHFAALQYFPLIVFLAAQPLRTYRQGLTLLTLVVVQCLTDPVYVGPAVLAPLGLLAATRLARRAWRPSGWRLLGVLAAGLLCLAPFMIGYVQVQGHNPALAQQTLWQAPRAMTSPWPTDLTALFWNRSRLPPISVGVVVVSLIVIGGLTGALRRWWGRGSGLGRPWAHASLWVVVCTFISFTPVAVLRFPWGMRTHVYLPQYLLALHTSLYETVRIPSRLGTGAMIGLCLLAGLAFAELARAVAALGVRGLSGPRARGTLAIVVAALVYHIPPAGMRPLPTAYPLQDAPTTDPELLDQLRATDGPLLELPVIDPRLKTPRVRPNAVAMYRSTFHWRPLVNGYSSYWPVGFIERVLPSLQLPAPPALRDLVCSTGVRTILVNLGTIPRDARAVWLRARNAPPPGLELIGAYQGKLLFAVTMPLPGQPGGPAC